MASSPTEDGAPLLLFPAGTRSRTGRGARSSRELPLYA
jgi:hypothetical protein